MKIEMKIWLFLFLLSVCHANLQAADDSAPSRGKEIYIKNCFACHQINGQGIPGVFPPLAKSDYLTNDIQRSLRAVCEGLTGEIVVNGRKLVGSAQVRRGGAFLQHGSILLDGSQDRVAGGTGETTLAVVLGRAATFEEVAAAVVDHWGERLTPSDSPTVRRSDVVASLAAR